MSRLAEEKQFRAGFREAVSTPKRRGRGRPPAPPERATMIFLAVVSAVARGHPLSPSSSSLPESNSSSASRRPGSPRGRASAFEVVADSLMKMAQRASRSADYSGWRREAISESAVREAFYRERRRLEAIARGRPEGTPLPSGLARLKRILKAG